MQLDRDVPRQHKQQVEQQAGEPDHAPQHLPLPPPPHQQHNDAHRHKGCDRTLGQRGQRAKKVKVEQPEFLASLVPRVPAQHANGKGRGKLHVRRCAAREGDGGRRGRRDQRRIKMSTGPKPPHVQENQEHHAERAGGGRQPRGPVAHTELFKEAHGAPVVQGRFLKPGMAVQNRRDGAGLGAPPRRAQVLPAQRTRNPLCVAVRHAAVMMRQQHLVGDLRVPWLVRPDQPDLRPGDDGARQAKRHHAIKQQQCREQAKHHQFAEGRGARGVNGAAQQVGPRCRGLLTYGAGGYAGLGYGAHVGAEAEANRLAGQSLAVRICITASQAKDPYCGRDLRRSRSMPASSRSTVSRRFPVSTQPAAVR